MIGIPSHIPQELASSSRFAVGLALLGVAFLAFFAGVAVLDSGRNSWRVTLVGAFAVLVAASRSLVRKKR
jgi:hypothetical protein